MTGLGLDGVRSEFRSLSRGLLFDIVKDVTVASALPARPLARGAAFAPGGLRGREGVWRLGGRGGALGF